MGLGHVRKIAITAIYCNVIIIIITIFIIEGRKKSKVHSMQ